MSDDEYRRTGVSPLNRALSSSRRSSGRTRWLFAALLVVLMLVVGGLVILPIF